MINIENAKKLRIKNANTEWWVHEQAVVADNGLTYITYFTDTGEIHIKELDAKCSKTPSRDFRLSKLNYNYADEHNAAGMCILENGKIIVGYTGHKVPDIHYRITERPYDIYSFGPERTISCDGAATYVQISENTKRGELWLFNREAGNHWHFRTSKDDGLTWSAPRTFFRAENTREEFDQYLKETGYMIDGAELSGLYYADIRKQEIKAGSTMDEQWFFAFYGHPYKSLDHSIRTGIFRSDGQLLKTDGTPTDFNLFEGDDVLNVKELDVVYQAPAGDTVRLSAVAATLPLRVGFLPFTMKGDVANPDPESPTYYSATFIDGKWQISAPICKAGEFLSKNVLDGSQSCLGGMAYYYGMGEYAINPKHKGRVIPTNNRIFIARFDGKDRVLECYRSTDYGQTYELEETFSRIPGEKGIKTWRPVVPVHAQGNLPVYWHEGVYTAHTGGWECDAVMLIEYDD